MGWYEVHTPQRSGLGAGQSLPPCRPRHPASSMGKEGGKGVALAPRALTARPLALMQQPLQSH